MEVGAEYEMQSLQPSTPKVIMPANESENGRKYEVQSQKWPSQTTSIPANESETEGKCEVQSQRPSSQKASMTTIKLKNEGEFDVQSEQSSSQKANMPGNESEDAMVTEQAPVEEQSQGQADKTPELSLVEVRVTRSASKGQETTKMGKLGVKNHAATTDRPKRNIMDAEGRLQNCESELKDSKKKLAGSKKDLKRTKSRLRSLRKDLAACRKSLKASKNVGHSLKANIRVLQRSLMTSKEELIECQDDLFGLQTVTQIPDSAVSRHFESLSQRIVEWIDAEVANFERAHPEAKPDQILSVGGHKYATTFLRLHSGAGEHLARFLIHRFLQDNVFGKQVYFFGLPEEIAQWLRKAEARMAELDPPRDSGAIASWRSETLKALVKTSECVDYGNKQVQDLNRSLFKQLSQALPIMFSGRETHATFYDQVLFPAVKLANTIRMSTSDYVFSIPRSPLTKFMPATKDMLKTHKMIDYKSGRQLKPDSPVVADQDGTIGNFILSLEPGLYRVVKGKKTTLHQELFLVELHHPLGKRSKASV